MDLVRYRWPRVSNSKFALALLAIIAAAGSAKAAPAAASPCSEALIAARLAVAEQKFAPALASVERCLAAEPLHSAALVLKGNLLYLLGRDADAMEVLEAVVKREPANWDARYALGRVYYFNQRPDPASAQFEAIVAAQPGHYRAWDNLGLAREAGGKIPEAIAAHMRAIALVSQDHRDYDWAHANLAELLMKQDENRKAFNLAVEAAERNPMGARNFYLAGKALFRLEQWDKCERWLKRSGQLDPTYPEPFYLLGQVYRRLGREPEAEQARQRFLELKAKAPDKKR